DRTYVSAQQQINQHNEVWADLIMPGNPVLVRETEALLREWRPH
ncbi:isochorismatase, partial [Klebsiella pneumoniae]|nr:isochorismatase [Klebsiella pneumoniae]